MSGSMRISCTTVDIMRLGFIQYCMEIATSHLQYDEYYRSATLRTYSIGFMFIHAIYMESIKTHLIEYKWIDRFTHQVIYIKTISRDDTIHESYVVPTDDGYFIVKCNTYLSWRIHLDDVPADICKMHHHTHETAPVPFVHPRDRPFISCTSSFCDVIVTCITECFFLVCQRPT